MRALKIIRWLTTRGPHARWTLEDHVCQLAEAAIAAGASQNKIDATIQAATSESGALLAEELRRRIPAMLDEHARCRRRFERNLAKRWGDALGLFYALYVGCSELGDEFNDRERPRAAADNDYRFEALARLHARACRVTSEVHALLCTGHAAGAAARARTLHEIAVTAYVLKDATAADAERYLLHAAAEAWKRALVFQPLAERLGTAPFTEDEMAEMRCNVERLEERFGPGFAAQYGWAEPLVGKRNPTFRDLQKHVSLDHLRPYYQWFSDEVHAGAKAAESVRVERGPQAVLVSGPTNFGLADPAQLAMTSLFQITIAFVLGDYPSVERLVMVRGIDALRTAAERAFVDAHLRLEDDEAAVVAALYDEVTPGAEGRPER